MPEFRLETERLILRDWRDEDFVALHALCTNPRVMETIGPPFADEDRTRLMLSRLRDINSRDGHTFWAMERKQDGRVIGFCGAARASVPPVEGVIEIGWRLSFDCWGQSYAREAAEATIGWLAANRPGERICAFTAVINARSRALMERLGMRRDEALDFDHPAFSADSPLQRHVVYWLDEPQ